MSRLRAVLFTDSGMSPRSAQSDPVPSAATAAVRLAVELGQAVRAERVRRGWPLRELARRAGLSVGAVCGIEAGEAGSLQAYARLAIALSLRPEFTFVDPRRHPDRRIADEDPVHAAMCETEAVHLRGLGYEVALDEPYQHYQFAGRADLIAWSRADAALLHVENRTRFPNVQEAIGSYTAKTRYLGDELAARVGVPGGWRSETHVIVALWSAEVLHVLRLRGATFAAVCAAGPDPLERWWRAAPPAPGRTSSLVLFDPVVGGRRDRHRFASLADAPTIRPRYPGYAAALAALRQAGQA